MEAFNKVRPGNPSSRDTAWAWGSATADHGTSGESMRLVRGGPVLLTLSLLVLVQSREFGTTNAPALFALS